MVTRKKAKPYHHGDLESALLQAALEAIRDEGVDAVTLRKVGARVGVSRTALYRHFEDKGALLARVSLEGFKLLRVALEGAAERALQSGTEPLPGMGLAYVRFAMENPSHYRTMFGRTSEKSALGGELAREAEAAFHELLDAVVARQRAGQLRDGDAMKLAQVIWAMVHGIAMLMIDGQLGAERGSGDTESFIRFAEECLERGIEAQAN